MAALREPSADQLSSGPDGELPEQRRVGRLLQVLAVVALIACAVAFGPDLLASSGPPQADQAPSPSASVPPSPTATTSPYAAPAVPGWRPRGDLAANESFVAAVLSRVRRALPDSSRALLFAATLPDGGRLALVAVGWNSRQRPEDPGVEVHALHLRPHQRVEDGRLEFNGNLASEDEFVGWAARDRKDHVNAVVLGPPVPLDAEVSAAINYRPDGTASRSWRRVQDRDGAAVVSLGRQRESLVVVRPRRGATPFVPLLISVDREERAAAQRVAFSALDVPGTRDPRYSGPPSISVLFALHDVAQAIFDVAEADLLVIWSGRVEHGERAALVRARMPMGHTFQVLVSAADETTAYTGSVRRVPWAAADVAPWLHLRPTGEILLLNPAGAGSATISQHGERPREVAIGDDGLASLTSAGLSKSSVYGATATIRDTDGDVVVRAKLTDIAAEDIFVLR